MHAQLAYPQGSRPHTYARMHVCMYACMHVCMYACMHVRPEPSMESVITWLTYSHSHICRHPSTTESRRYLLCLKRAAKSSQVKPSQVMAAHLDRGKLRPVADEAVSSAAAASLVGVLVWVSSESGDDACEYGGLARAVPADDEVDARAKLHREVMMRLEVDELNRQERAIVRVRQPPLRPGARGLADELGQGRESKRTRGKSASQQRTGVMALEEPEPARALPPCTSVSKEPPPWETFFRWRAGGGAVPSGNSSSSRPRRPMGAPVDVRPDLDILSSGLGRPPPTTHCQVGEGQG